MVPSRAIAKDIGPKEAPLLLLHTPVGLVSPLKSVLSEGIAGQGGVLVDIGPKAERVLSASSELRRAVAAYHEFDFQSAMKHLNDAIVEAVATGAAGLSTSELSDLFMFRALVRKTQGDSTSAWEDFVQAALIAPTRHLDAVRFSPSVVASFERARKEVAEGKYAALRVKVESSCEVFVDARSLGPELPISLPIGKHFLRVSCVGKNTYASQVLLLATGQEISPQLHRPEIPSPEALASIARSRGFGHFIWVHADTGTVAGPIAVFELWQTGGKLLARTKIGLSLAPSDRQAVERAMERLESYWAPKQSVLAVPPRVVATEVPWYRSPWVWAGAGALVATSVLLPFVLDSSSPDGFDVRLGGAKP